MRSIYIVFILCLACTSHPNENVEGTNGTGISERGRMANMEKAEMYDLISVVIGTPRDRIAVTEQHLHGKFFQDRAEFYVIEKPELFISGTEVNELTLYFIDSMLCKKKYELSADISPELIKSYGGFKFIPLNHRTRDIAKSEPIIRQTKTGKVLNDRLERYEMKWDTEEIMIRYKLDRDSLTSEILLMEELSAYKYLLIEAEAGII